MPGLSTLAVMSKVTKKLRRPEPPQAAASIQAAYRGRAYRRASAFDREPKAHVISRWQQLVSKTLARSGGMNWGAITSALKVGFVPVSEDALAAMAEHCQGITARQICEDSRQTARVEIETVAGQSDLDDDDPSADNRQCTPPPQSSTPLPPQPSAQRPVRFHLKTYRPGKLPSFDSSSRFMSDSLSVSSSNVPGDRLQVTTLDQTGHVVSRFRDLGELSSGGGLPYGGLSAAQIQQMSSRLHRHFEQRKQTVRHEMETRRSLLDAMTASARPPSVAASLGASPIGSRRSSLSLPASPAGSFNSRSPSHSVMPRRQPSLHSPHNSLPASRRPSNALPPLDLRSQSTPSARPPPPARGGHQGSFAPTISTISSPSLAMIC